MHLATMFVVSAVSHRLSDSHGTRTNNHLVRKQTLNHSAKAASIELCCEYLSYLYGAFDCMF